jgi:hypothetical protein
MLFVISITYELWEEWSYYAKGRIVAGLPSITLVLLIAEGLTTLIHKSVTAGNICRVKVSRGATHYLVKTVSFYANRQLFNYAPRCILTCWILVLITITIFHSITYIFIFYENLNLYLYLKKNCTITDKFI